MHTEKLFEAVKVIFEKQVFEVRKKSKTNIWNLHLSEKIAILFQNLPACGKKINFFSRYNQKYARRTSLSVWKPILKNKSPNYIKVKKPRFEVLFFVKKKIIFYSEKKYARAKGGKFFTGLYSMMCKEKFLKLVRIRFSWTFIFQIWFLLPKRIPPCASFGYN